MEENADDWATVGRAISEARKEIPGLEVSITVTDEGWRAVLLVPISENKQIAQRTDWLALEDIPKSIWRIAANIMFTLSAPSVGI